MNDKRYNNCSNNFCGKANPLHEFTQVVSDGQLSISGSLCDECYDYLVKIAHGTGVDIIKAWGFNAEKEE